ncbi:MAG: hypothetical protein IJX65_05795, partial [Alistipes sp.]|nr:hypothetical protein [Alistipes sp.]
GDPNAGKTTASRFILQVLLYQGAKLVSYTALNGLGNLKGDFVAVIEYKKKRIAICSRGDQLNWVLTNITTYIDLDVVVVTSRNYATFDKAVRNVYNPIVFNKQKSNYTALTKFVQAVVKQILKP